MHPNDVIRWTFVWWLVDGIGLCIASYRLRHLPAAFVGLAGVVCGGFGIALNLRTWWYGSETPGRVTFALLALMISALVCRYTILDARILDRRWRRMDSPPIWCGVHALLICAMVAVTLVVMIVAGRRLTVPEYALWSWVMGAVVATFGRGGYGLSLSAVGRWTLRITVPAAFIAAAVLMVRR